MHITKTLQLLILPFIFLLTATITTVHAQEKSSEELKKTINDSTTIPNNVVEVRALDYAFIAPDSIPSGWVTFRMTNKGKETHYFQLSRLPEGRTYQEFLHTFAQPVDSLQQLLLAGKIDTTEAEQTVARITPDWVANGLFKNLGGGVANLAPGRTTQTTIKMEPGTYVMSCILKSPNRKTHASQGTESASYRKKENTDASPPEPDVTICTSGHEVTTEGTLRAGKQTVAYHVDKSSAEMDDFYWSALLARIESDADVNELRQANLLQNPPPVDFLGGLEYVAPGKTAYTELDLKPGRYAWVMHGQRDTVRTFTIE
ncbi:MAG: hypothetical protein U5K69_13700 [Balneolaceae bacterium]|nr:hypothetical protein [Balneolaceae bacterium]